MYLKKLEIQGFKSFPEYTLIEFDRGMTAIVGPNGSGKSNVTDAVRWVLGEQSVKSLRGGKMEDVIFNGTQSRKAMNYAEVTMTLDNHDHYVDSDFEEIEITRRLYRSGESEYRINHVNCRLKDITSMFLDTGLGKDGYSIVGQGRVDEILSTKSEDRRRVLEEASGIVKYKVRKEESERKLNSTTQNLTRIDDLLGEIEGRIGPLKEQSEKAQLYNITYEKLRTLDIAMLCSRITKANEAMGGSGDVREQLEKELSEQEKIYSEIRSSNTELSSKAEELENQIEDRRQELSDATEELHELKSSIRVSEERKNQIQERIDNFAVNEENTNKEIAELNSQRKEKLENAEKLLDRANKESKNGEALTSQMQELLYEYNQREEARSEIKKKIDQKTSELQDVRGQMSSLTARIESTTSRIDALSIERKTETASLEDKKKALSEADKKWHEMMDTEGDVTSDIASREESLKKLRSDLSSKVADYEKKNREFVALRSKLTTLEELEKRKEGYQEAVRKLLIHAERDNASARKIVGVLGDLIDVDKKYETAIEIALGSGIHNIVTRTERDASDLISVLKENHYGRITFLPIENIEPRELEDKYYSDARRMNGFIGIASDLVDCKNDIKDIISNLLGRIIICDNMDNALRMAGVLKHKVKVITLEGDCINPGGSLTGGSIRRNAAGILGRTREIEEINEKSGKLEQDLGIVEAERQQTEEKIHDIRKELDQLDAQLKYFSMERVKAESEYRSTESLIKTSEDRISAIDKELDEISAERLKMSEDLEEANLVLGETEASITEFKSDDEMEGNAGKEFTDRINELRTKISASSNEANRLITERNGILQIAEVLQNEINKHAMTLKNSEAERIADEARIKEIIEEIASCREKMSGFSEKATVLTEKVNALKEARNEIDKQMSGIVTKLAEQADRVNDIRNKLTSLEAKYEKYIVEIDDSKNRLWEDYEVTYDNVKASCAEITNVTETTKEISQLRGKIRSIGPVNPDAIEEYKDVSERYEFMTSQRNDIVEAKTNLEKVIADITDEMKTQFNEQFAIINENFKRVFTDLFNGGTAEIVLDDEDVLTCGIEIKAQPPGKKLQSLTLLSGGERCLTAIGLLFAILQLRPSPFVILDEVEAALDDVNVNRFADFVKRYTVRSQFMVVTHRKGTMEACDRMYGVTMQERGISKILSMRLGDAE